MPEQAFSDVRRRIRLLSRSDKPEVTSRRSPSPSEPTSNRPVLRRNDTSPSPVSRVRARIQSLIGSITGLQLDTTEHDAHDSEHAVEAHSIVVPDDSKAGLQFPVASKAGQRDSDISSDEVPTDHEELRRVTIYEENDDDESDNIPVAPYMTWPQDADINDRPPERRLEPMALHEQKDIPEHSRVEEQMRVTSPVTVRQEGATTRHSVLGYSSIVRGLSNRLSIANLPIPLGQSSESQTDAMSSSKHAPRSRRVRFEGSSVDVTCEDAPWEDEPGGETVVPEFVGERTKTGLWRASPKHLAQNRRVLWGVVQLALAGTVSEESVFRSSGPGQSFALEPAPRSSVPLQWLHVGIGTIPDSVGDALCVQMSVSDLLNQLNSVIGTKHTLQTPGLQNLLEHIRGTTRDFGEAYGKLRPWWSKNPSTVLQNLERREREVAELRSGAIRESWIENSHIPPRRVWDLYSNRVLPFHVLPLSDQFFDKDVLPEDLWTVSHSWAADDDRFDVSTNINGQRWPVPIPRWTSLDHVRVELLNMGAEYVWLDVLCLRQRGSEAYEETRRNEWKLDVPTIGHIFQGHPRRRPCVVYFNGLGLPIDTSPNSLQSEKHWFNRVWTLQESLETWLPGGLTGGPFVDGKKFFARLDEILRGTHWTRKRVDLVKELKRRKCTKELDRVSGLAYYLECKTLPLYEENMPPEDAWSLLIKHMPEWERMCTFLQYTVSAPFGLWVSWEAFLNSSPIQPHLNASQGTLFVQRLRGSIRLPPIKYPGTRYHHHGRIFGPYHIRRKSGHAIEENARPEIIIQAHAGQRAVSLRPSGLHGVLLQGVPYYLVYIGKRRKGYWIVIEVVGEQRGIIRRAVEAVKWGVIGVRRSEGKVLQKLPDEGDSTLVAYLDGEEAKRKSKHAERYMQAFKRMQLKGHSVTFEE